MAGGVSLIIHQHLVSRLDAVSSLPLYAIMVFASTHAYFWQNLLYSYSSVHNLPDDGPVQPETCEWDIKMTNNYLILIVHFAGLNTAYFPKDGHQSVAEICRRVCIYCLQISLPISLV